MRQRIAVIGGGISGLGAAWALHKDHDLVVYEAGKTLGGHSNTVDVETPNGPIPVDTGFIVYNERTYPHLTRLFSAIAVPTQESDMSFAFSLDRAFEYGATLKGLAAQPSNLFRTRYRSMISDIVRFRKLGPDLEPRDDETIEALLKRHGFRAGFLDDFLVPMTAAIWSARHNEIRRFPATSILQFMSNHGLIRYTDRPTWRTVTGGSRQYVRLLARPFLGSVRLSSPVGSVERLEDQVLVTSNGRTDTFDQVILATHSDQALSILGSGATPGEAEALGAIRYEPNEVVLHSDPTLMPARRSLWSSWNAMASSLDRETAVTSVTYWMNRLQSLDTELPLFVSLNPIHEPEPSLIHGRFQYSHPQFDLAAVEGQLRLAAIQGRARTWFAGAFCGYGFHEDGLQAGFNVAAALGSPPPWWDSTSSDEFGINSESGRSTGMTTAPSHRSCLYRGTVRHTRLRPQHHDFKYRVYYGLWDVDELQRLDRGLKWFSLNRFNLFSLSVGDHGAGDGTPLRRWAEEVLSQASVEIDGGRIQLLAYPRVLGYVFNPISVWYCYNPDDRLVAVIHEVRNTFGDKHSYVVPIEDELLPHESVAHEFQKLLHVSPFNDLDSTYRISLTRPGARLGLSIHQGDKDGTFLRAGLSLTRLPLTDSNLMKLFWSHPLLTLKVVGGIHWQAMRLWFKGAHYHSHPAPPEDTVTLVEDLRRVG